MAPSLLDPEARELLDALLDAVAILDPDLTIVYLNASWRRAAAPAENDADVPEGEFAAGRRYVACGNAALGAGAEDAELIAAGLRGERADRSSLMDGPGTTRWLQTRVIPYGEQGSRRLLVSKRDVSRDVAQEQSLTRYHATLKAVGFAASQFLGDEVWEHSVGRVLQRFGEATDVSRVYVFNARQAPEGEWLCSQLHEWAAPGIKPEISNPDLQDMPFIAVGFQRWVDMLSADQPVYGMVRDFPASERAILEPQQITSIAVVPIFVEGVCWGFIGFDECRVARIWSAAEIEALRAAAGLFGAAIQHQRSQEVLRERLGREEIIRVQEAALRELEAPLLPVHEGVLVMPLVGSMDAGRAQRVLETLLEGVGRGQARVVILDVTGIRRLDAGVADALVRVARAVGLLGAEVVLTGITPEVARTLVELGAELSGIATSMNLQSGMARALRAVRGR